MGDRRKQYPDLSDEEYKVLTYFMSNVSVGEILAVRELESIMGLKEPRRIIESLIEKGYIERGSGCYNLSRKKFPRS
ncbi:MAG TPA: hypothetical protein ENO36_02280 [Fervidicoccus fontis]|uniref:MarR family transcriptional regulator n=1 Tax=Fervidicoccus fontis TaxID=683846 RepID=A0A7C2UQ81_9CREN|nr:MAG: hypothetical protein C0179_01595 [Fervidicoccus sp.]HEU97667.1 hypothetical protein [Fervidicoccus fontis]